MNLRGKMIYKELRTLGHNSQLLDANLSSVKPSSEGITYFRNL
jgi:hypothetical protein